MYRRELGDLWTVFIIFDGMYLKFVVVLMGVVVVVGDFWDFLWMDDNAYVIFWVA